MQRFRIECDDRHVQRVFIDGVELNCVKNATLRLSTGKFPTLELELLPDALEVEGNAEITMEET